MSGGEGGSEKGLEWPARRSEASDAAVRNVGREATQLERAFTGGQRRMSGNVGGGKRGLQGRPGEKRNSRGCGGQGRKGGKAGA